MDLYIVSSRCEGGPQALFECAYLKTPIITTKVGQHHLIDDNCKYDLNQKITNDLILKSSECIQNNFKNIKPLLYNNHISLYDDFFEGVIK